MELGAEYLYHHNNHLGKFLRDHHFIPDIYLETHQPNTIESPVYFSELNKPFHEPWLQTITETDRQMKDFFFNENAHKLDKYSRSQLKSLSWGQVFRDYLHTLLTSNVNALEEMTVLKEAVYDLAIRWVVGNWCRRGFLSPLIDAVKLAICSRIYRKTAVWVQALSYSAAMEITQPTTVVSTSNFSQG